MKPFIFGETAFHHQGDIEYLLKLIDLAAECKLSAIKFQVLIKTENLLSFKHPDFATISKYILTEEEWQSAFERAINLKLELVIMPLDLLSFKLIEKYKSNVHMLELHSVSFYDEELLYHMRDSQLPIMLGVGGRTDDEIREKKRFFESQLKVLMVGFQAFPSTINEVKLARITYLKSKYPNLIVGYADHSGYSDPMAVDSNDYAFVLGARYFEKHFTLSEGEKRVDYDSAIGSGKLKLIHKRLNLLNNQLGLDLKEDDLFSMTESELKYRNRQRVAIASKDILAGELIDQSNIIFRMTGGEEGISEMKKIKGYKAKQKIEQYTVISKDILAQ